MGALRILNLSYDDWANFAYDNCQALRSVGLDAHSLKKVSHTFNYNEQSRVASHQEIVEEIKKADIVQLMHSDSTFLKVCVSLNKRITVYHTGTGYRMNPEQCNNIFNDYVERSFTDQCEFIGCGMKNETYIATAINTDKIHPVEWQTEHPFTIAHYPSNADVKGSTDISRMIGDVKRPLKYLLSLQRLSHEEQLLRMSQCDIYIELFKPVLYGKPYGCFGVTAFEAAALGKIVITNNIHEEVYRSAYGDCGLCIANTEEQFVETLKEILSLDIEKIKTLQERTRQWIVDKHSYQKTGEYLKTILNI
jgi:hypothetical protein